MCRACRSPRAPLLRQPPLDGTILAAREPPGDYLTELAANRAGNGAQTRVAAPPVALAGRTGAHRADRPILAFGAIFRVGRNIIPEPEEIRGISISRVRTRGARRAPVIVVVRAGCACGKIFFSKKCRDFFLHCSMVAVSTTDLCISFCSKNG
jgi:hypothetical protein